MSLELHEFFKLPSSHPMQRSACLSYIIDEESKRLVNAAKKSPSRLFQDMFVLHKTGFKKSGYFVEFGASNDYSNSNTWVLEKFFDWQGIVAEPARIHHTELFANRNCNIETDYVWHTSGTVLDFRESTNAELSTIEAFHQSDGHAENRNNGRVYQVRTISLMDMLLKYNAPAEIDYLSIDTEGSELEILKALDYDKYRIRLITCEHNHTFMRSKIKELLTKKGYAIVNRDFADFDDWYELA